MLENVSTIQNIPRVAQWVAPLESDPPLLCVCGFPLLHVLRSFSPVVQRHKVRRTGISKSPAVHAL